MARECGIMSPMVKGALATVSAALLLGLGATGLSAEEPARRPAPSILMELTNRPAESQEQAFKEAIKSEAQAPAPSPVDDWIAQPDGSMRHRKTGITMIVRNPCPPGGIDHEFALAAYNRALAARNKARR